MEYYLVVRKYKIMKFYRKMDRVRKKIILSKITETLQGKYGIYKRVSYIQMLAFKPSVSMLLSEQGQKL